LDDDDDDGVVVDDDDNIAGVFVDGVANAFVTDTKRDRVDNTDAAMYKQHFMTFMII